MAASTTTTDLSLGGASDGPEAEASAPSGETVFWEL
jgi:hypothetical protein